jgi:pyroglutamyl-peptidase
MKALVTGFDPFGGDAMNPSYEAVRRLPACIGALDIVTAELPTSFKRAMPTLRALIRREGPDIVLCVGLAAERNAISVERVAVNLQHSRMADNDGASPVDKFVVARAPEAYFSTLPVKHVVDALTRAGIPAEMSMSAGAFVCNHVFYSLMHLLAHQKHGRHMLRAGFVHVPALPENHAAHEAKLSQWVKALEIVLDVTRRRIGKA